MRLIGVLASCFVLLAALIYGYQHRQEFGLRLADRLEDMIPADIAAVDARDLPDTSDDNEAIMPMREAGRLNALSGFPGYARATFALPRTASPQSGVLVLDLNGALEDGAQGALRVTVNGVPRTELVLGDGRLRRRVMVPLNTRDLSGREVVVSLSAEGRTPQIACSADWAGGVVAQIMPSSHVKLVLDAPLSDPADILLSRTAPLLLEWPTDRDLRAETLKAAHVYYSVARDDVLFAHADSGGLAVDQDLLTALEQLNGPGDDHADQDALDLVEGMGRNRSVIFEGEAQWRMVYDRRHFAAGVPAQFDLQMSYDAAGDKSGWLMSVRLNNRIVHSEELIDASGSIARKIALPTEDQPMLNEMRVTLTSAEQRPDRCMEARPASADIDLARLTLDASAEPTVWTEVLDVLSGDMNLSVHPQLDANGAQLALNLLNMIEGGKGLSLHTKWTDRTTLPLMTAVPGPSLEEFLAKVNEEHSWVVSDTTNPDGLVLVRVADVDASLFASAPRAVLVIEERPHYSSADAG
tara:strand:+ start:2311 stop:3885 length:1575 start_codon:yes stop_codon:yes gene_type:complete